MPFTPGTLNEYDMIIAVSQDAINAQFKILFTTPNPKDTKVNLIPKELKLGYKKYDPTTQTMKDSKRGITADIECPTVDINALGDGGTLYRSVRIIIKMTTGTLTYYDEGDLETLDVAGYTLSWVAQLGTKTIQDIEEEAMHPDAKKTIKASLKGVDNEDYLVSSLFCLFESTQVTKSFKFVDKIGAKATDPQVAMALEALILTYSNPDLNPYVLGYSVSQKIAKPTTGTPAFFPAKLYLSTTPNSTDNAQASLNVCIINGDPHDAKLVDPTLNHDAGVLSTPFINVTRASSLKSDGIFAVSDALFFNHWLKPTIFDTFSFSGRLFGGVKMDVKTKITGGNGFATASKNQDWTSALIESQSLSGTSKHSRQYSGYSKMNITYTSLLQSQTSGEISANAKRSVTVKVVGEVYHKVQFYANTYGGWIDEGYLDSTTKWDFSLLVTAGKNGKWSVERSSWNIPGTTTSGNHIIALADQNSLTESLQLSLPSETSNYFNLENLTNFYLDLAGLPVSTFDGILNALKSISISIIVPGGDVYTFLGLDSDDAGNLYSHIKYTKA